MEAVLHVPLSLGVPPEGMKCRGELRKEHVLFKPTQQKQTLFEPVQKEQTLSGSIQKEQTLFRLRRKGKLY